MAVMKYGPAQQGVGSVSFSVQTWRSHFTLYVSFFTFFIFFYFKLLLQTEDILIS